MFCPNRFSSVWLGLNVGLNLRMCATVQLQFQLPVGASNAQCAPETLAEPTELVPCMAQATRTQTARGRGMQDRISIPVRAVQLCHTVNYLLRKLDPHRGQSLRSNTRRPEMVPRAAVPRRDIKSETRSVSYLFSLREGMEDHFVLYSIAYLKSPPFSMNRPMPMATESMGDLATIVRMPVTREINRSMPARSAPPPESMMPVS